MRRWEGKIIRSITWIAAAVLITAVILLVAHLSANNLEFSRYNVGWNGTSSFFSDLDRHRTTDITDPAQLAGFPRNSTLLIVAPYRHPDPRELIAYQTFLDEGNTIFIADDFGTGNEILSGIGSRITISHINLSSLDRQYPDPYSLIVYRSQENSSVILPPDLALNRPTSLEGGSPLMLTSVMSWMDTNSDRRLNLNEPMGTFPVMADESRGAGRIIVLADPSIFINSMYIQGENANNRLFIHNLISGDGPLLIDQINSRTADASGLSGILHVIRNTEIIEIILLCLLMLFAAWAWKERTI